jgi:hypothetical protein
LSLYYGRLVLLGKIHLNIIFGGCTEMRSMKTFKSLLLFIFFATQAFSQPVHVGIFTGAAAYNGDLVNKYFPGHGQTNIAFGITMNYELTERLMLRGGATFIKVAGADSLNNKPNLQLRNLSFQTSIKELSVLAEYYVFSLYEQRYSPYFFGGVAFYHFDPFAYTPTGERAYLQQLSTEGQGLSGYPDKPYSLTQFAIPFGAGIKFAINDDLHIGLEFGMRKLFTDYIDDVSKNYPDQADLFAAKGFLAVKMSYRGDEVPGGNLSFPAKGAQRGSATKKDFYYTFGLHLTYRLGGENYSESKGKIQECPANPL